METELTTKTLRLSAPLWEQIGEFRHRERYASESEAVRRLLVLGLKVAPRDPAAWKKEATLRRSIRFPVALWEDVEAFQHEARIDREIVAVRQLLLAGLAAAAPRQEVSA